MDTKGTSRRLKPHSGHPQRVCGNVVPHHNWWSNLPKAPTWRRFGIPLQQRNSKRARKRARLRSARGKFAIHWTRFRITSFLFRGIADLTLFSVHCKGLVTWWDPSVVSNVQPMGPRNAGKTAILLLLPGRTHFGAIVRQISSDK